METKDILVLILLIIVGGGGYGWHRRRLVQLGQSWRKLAKRLGGQYESDGNGWITEPNNRVTCEIDGYELTLYTNVSSTGSSTTYWTQVSTPCDPALQLNISKEDGFGKLGKAVGLQDVELHDSNYDKAFLIKSTDPTGLRQLVTEEFKKAHLEHRQFSISAKDGRIGVIHRGLVPELDAAHDMLKFAALAAATFQQ